MYLASAPNTNYLSHGQQTSLKARVLVVTKLAFSHPRNLRHARFTIQTTRAAKLSSTPNNNYYALDSLDSHPPGSTCVTLDLDISQVIPTQVSPRGGCCIWRPTG
ncbi:hypothetical protein V1477_002446 [Vespula maculifrons]|uniref:Uncharacterized protein n=1 Tax=Vespula maculifrons TaxID=7453 RepID=A0ABD2CWV4_VESMC